jgi:hypothetical protein
MRGGGLINVNIVIYKQKSNKILRFVNINIALVLFINIFICFFV